MAHRSRPSFTKRQKEMARQQKQQDKRARRLEAKERQAQAQPHTGEDDPSLAGIKPGPQPPPQWLEPARRRT